jgi:hypothetical protein
MDFIVELYGRKKMEWNQILTSSEVSSNVRDDCCKWLVFLTKLKMGSIELITQILPNLQILKSSLTHIQYSKTKEIFDKTSQAILHLEIDKLIIPIVDMCHDVEQVGESFGCREKISTIIHFFVEIQNLYCGIMLVPNDEKLLDQLITILEKLQLSIV